MNKIIPDTIVSLGYAILDTAVFMFNYINPIPTNYIIGLIIVNIIYLVYFGSNNVKFTEHMKLLIAIFVLVFLFMVLSDKFYIKGVYSIYNNIMYSFVPPIWIVSLYSNKYKLE